MTDFGKIHDYIQSKREEIVNELCALVRIPSVSGTKEVNLVLDYTKALYEKNGFDCELRGDYLLSKFNEGKKNLGLFAHADVVEAKGRWDMCENPFEPTVKDDTIFARGVTDDKGGIVVSLYAMKIIKELGIPFSSGIIAFIGSNEETTMQDIKSYTKEYSPPTFSLVLDAGFPLYLGDKGILWLDCIKNEKLHHLLDIRGGSATNIVLGEATARIKYNEKLFSELAKNKEIKTLKSGDEIIVHAVGISSHGAMPQGSRNAGSMILNALFEAKSFSKADKESLAFVSKILNSYDGRILGIEASDCVFGDTTVTNGVLKIENERLEFSLDIRHGSTYTTEQHLNILEKVFEKEKISFKVKKQGDANAVSEDNKYVMACMDAYRKHTGNENATPHINVGATYSKFLKNSCEIGVSTKYPSVNLAPGHGAAHQPDEALSIEGLLEALEITVKMLIECDKIKE